MIYAQWILAGLMVFRFFYGIPHNIKQPGKLSPSQAAVTGVIVNIGITILLFIAGAFSKIIP